MQNSNNGSNDAITNGWELYFQEYFIKAFSELIQAIEKVEPDKIQNHTLHKLYKSILKSVFIDVPTNQQDKKFHLGKTLGDKYRAWKRVKNGLPARYRMFFKYQTISRVKIKGQIIYVWFNNSSSLRKENSRTDVYEVFKKMINRQIIPGDIDKLISSSHKKLL